MRTICITIMVLTGIICTKAQEIKNLSFSTATENIIQQEFTLNANINDVWKVWTTEKGLQTWFAPVVKINWKRGGTLKSRFEVGGIIGERNTVISHIIDYIPNKRIVLKDNLTFLLSYGIVQKWIQNVSDEFMFELIAEGGDLFTTIEFEKISEKQTKLVIYVTGYKTNEEWNTQFKNAISANEWAFKKLIYRFEKGPVDWTKN